MEHYDKEREIVQLGVKGVVNNAFYVYKGFLMKTLILCLIAVVLALNVITAVFKPKASVVPTVFIFFPTPEQNIEQIGELKERYNGKINFKYINPMVSGNVNAATNPQTYGVTLYNATAYGKATIAAVVIRYPDNSTYKKFQLTERDAYNPSVKKEDGEAFMEIYEPRFQNG